MTTTSELTEAREVNRSSSSATLFIFAVSRLSEHLLHNRTWAWCGRNPSCFSAP